jgi:hypothetical protein
VFQLFISLWNRYRQSFADIKLIQICAFPASYSRINPCSTHRLKMCRWKKNVELGGDLCAVR